MLDSRMLMVGGTIRLTVPTYVDDVATTPSSITVTAYKNGIATGDSITPTLDHYGTGLSLVSYTPSGLAAGDTVTLKISATVSGTTRVTVAEFSVMSTAAAIAALVAAGTVAGVSGDVTGKVLGGGSGTISGVGARVVDGDGSAIATAASIAALFTTAMTEAYPTDGSTVTPAQALYLILAHLNERTVSGTTITLKKLDGSTTAATFTINDANTPTSITRAS